MQAISPCNCGSYKVRCQGGGGLGGNRGFMAPWSVTQSGQADIFMFVEQQNNTDREGNVFRRLSHIKIKARVLTFWVLVLRFGRVRLWFTPGSPDPDHSPGNYPEEVLVRDHLCCFRPSGHLSVIHDLTKIDSQTLSKLILWFINEDDLF